jgi:signal transduction histidine kinase
MSSALRATPVEEWRKYTILIVDDEPHILGQLQRELKLAGFKTALARSGEDGLRVLDLVPAKLVISDQKMAASMSGTEFLAQVRHRHPEVLTMVLSAFSEQEYLMDAVNRAGVYQYLLKPWDRVDLLHRVSQALQFYHAQAERRRLAEANEQLLKKMALVESFSLIGDFSDALYDRFFPVLQALLREARRKIELSARGSYAQSAGIIECEAWFHLTTVINRLGRVSQFYRQVPEYQLQSAASIVKECVDEAKAVIQQRTMGVEFLEAYEWSAPDLLLQRETFSCAIKALIENAVLFNPRHDGLKVFVRVFRPQDSPGVLRIEVHDNGPGVAAVDRERIFSPLYSTCHQESSPSIQFTKLEDYNFSSCNHVGLGLSIARWCLTQHDASVELVDDGVPGATFRVDIQIEQSQLRQQL